jgi:hypothetical protein
VKPSVGTDKKIKKGECLMEWISRILIAVVLILMVGTTTASAEEEDIPLNKVPQKVLEAS